MQAGLMKLRKQLTVETGPSAAELAAQKAESPAADEAAADTLNQEAASESEVVRRFFQVRLTADTEQINAQITSYTSIRKKHVCMIAHQRHLQKL